jgi:hypothetical protein
MEGTSQAVLGSSSEREGAGQPVDLFFSSFIFSFQNLFPFVFTWDIHNDGGNFFSEKLEIYFHFQKMVKITQKSRNSESKTNTL